MRNLIKSYIFSLVIILLSFGFASCGGGGGGNDWNFMDRFIPVITEFSQMPAWESWVMAAPIEGDDGNDYSFIARLIIVRDGNSIVGIGNANGYPMGTFAITGTRVQDNLEFKITSQNRYRALELTGKGIYVNADTEIGGNSLTGQDFATTFDDPIKYTGNFQINVGQLESVEVDTAYIGSLDGAYNSIEDGTIRFRTSEDGTTILVEELTGALVGESASEGTFEITQSGILGNTAIEENRFTFHGGSGGYVVEIDGAISGGIASGFVVIEKLGHVYIGAFSAIAE